MTPIPAGIAAAAARPARYLSVGAVCAAAHNAIMIGGDWAGGHYLAMSVISFAFVTPLAFRLHCRFTFRERPSWKRFARFATGVATGFPLSVLVLAILCTGLGLPVIVAAPIATVALVVWNYTAAQFTILGRLGIR